MFQQSDVSLVDSLRVCVWLLVLAINLAVAANGAAVKRNPVVTWRPAKLVGGSPVLFQFSAPRAQTVSAKWFGHQLQFFQAENGSAWYALAGVPVETKAGIYDLDLTEVLPSGPVQIVKKITIGKASYLRIPLHVAKQFTEPSPDQLKQITADKTLKQDVLATETGKRLWAGQFVAPVSAPTSDVFGTERVFNGEVKSRHLGLDYAAPAGTEVHAVNRGTVLLARPLFFEGNCVVIDHGQGVLSLYLHLSEFKVKEGDSVETGQAIALSGGSGRATGPHLHLAIRWKGVYLNPAVLLSLQVP